MGFEKKLAKEEFLKWYFFDEQNFVYNGGEVKGEAKKKREPARDRVLI